MMREGDYLAARPACYEIISVGYRAVTCVVIAGSDTVKDRYVVWAVSQVEAAIRHGDLQLVSERPAWLDPPTATPTGTAKKRARAQTQGRLG